MPRYIEWFLVETERRLRGSLAPDELHQTLGEVEEHLGRDYQDALGKGMTDARAELVAIHRFGSPATFARSVWREQANSIFGRPADVAGTWLGWSAFALAAAVALCAGYQWLDVLESLLLAGVALGLVFAVAAFRSRRWLTRRMLPAFGVTAIALFCFFGLAFVPNLGGGLLRRGDVAGTIRDMEIAAARLERDAPVIGAIAAAYSAAESAEDVPARYRFGSPEGRALAVSLGDENVPAGGFMAPRPRDLGRAGDQTVTGTTVAATDFATARAAWRRLERQPWAANSQARHLREDIATLKERAGAWFALSPQTFVLALYVSLWPLAILTLLNAAGLVLGVWRRARPWTVALTD